MTARALVLRPSPGAERTAERLRRLGVAVELCPLFAVAPVAWTPPDPGRFDALILTSANAARVGGAGLTRFRSLPVFAVGAATAAAAREVGFHVAGSGDDDAVAAVRAARDGGHARLLHLAGRERIALPGVEQVTVYASDPVPVTADTVRGWADAVALLHSARAARRFAELVDEHGAGRSRIAIAALSPAVDGAAGGGWGRRAIAARPDDALLTVLARELIDQPWSAADKLRA